MPSRRVSLKGKGADLFFGDYKPDQEALPILADAVAIPPLLDAPLADDTTPEPTPTTTHSSPTPPIESGSTNGQPAKKRTQARSISNIASEPARKRASSSARLPESAHAREDADVVQAIRKVVRVSGKDVSYVRLTPEEKAQLADIIYAYKRQGQKTTENEIYRIALNYLLNDYHELGDASLLARVLAALQA